MHDLASRLLLPLAETVEQRQDLHRHKKVNELTVSVEVTAFFFLEVTGFYIFSSNVLHFHANGSFCTSMYHAEKVKYYLITLNC